MRLCYILEGWRPEPGAMDHSRAKAALGQRRSSQAFNQAMGGRFVHVDDPIDPDDMSDLIKTAPKNTARELAGSKEVVHFGELSPDPHALESFKGSKLYYGFEFVGADKYADNVTNVAKFQDGPELQAELKALDKKRADLMRLARTAISHNDQKELNFANSKLEQIADREVEIHAILADPDDMHAGNETFKKYYKKMKYAFANALKHPDPNNTELRDQFISMAIENFVGMTGEYDVITYPESKSSFNKVFADALADYYGFDAVPGFVKRKTRDVTVNRAALNARYNSKSSAGDQRRANLAKRGNDETDSEREARKLDRLISQYNPNEPPSIKNVQYGDKRRYLNLYDLHPNLQVQGKRVLIIDDNVVNMATMELVHAMATQGGAASVDVYTPLLMGKD